MAEQMRWTQPAWSHTPYTPSLICTVTDQTRAGHAETSLSHWRRKYSRATCRLPPERKDRTARGCGGAAPSQGPRGTIAPGSPCPPLWPRRSEAAAPCTHSLSFCWPIFLLTFSPGSKLCFKKSWGEKKKRKSWEPALLKAIWYHIPSASGVFVWTAWMDHLLSMSDCPHQSLYYLMELGVCA